MLQLDFYGKDLFSADKIVVLTRRVIQNACFHFFQGISYGKSQNQ